MKLLLLCAFVAVARGAAVAYVPAAPVLETGASAQFRSEDNHGNYDFGYNEDHTSGGSFRREVGDAHGNVAGSYGLRDADGRMRIVNYIANDDGFRADIKTNEPGVEPKDPADARINKPAPLVLAADIPVPIVAPAPVLQPVAVKSFAVPAPVVRTTVVEPAHYAVPAEPLPYAFPAPAVEPLPYAFPAPAVEPLPYAFPAPAAIPVAKSAYVHPAPAVEPLPYAFPAPAAVPLAKSAYVHPAPAVVAAVPLAKTSTVVQEHIVANPAVYSFPAPAAIPVAKSSFAVAAPTTYAFPAPAAVPVAKSSVIVQETAPATYAFPAPAAIPVAKSHLAYSAPLAVPATSGFAYSTRVINNAPNYYGLPYNGYPYGYNPFYNLHSPVVSFAGPVLRFNNIAYPGFPVVKK